MTNIYANTFHFVDPYGKDPVPCEMRIEVNEIVSPRENIPTQYQIVMRSNYPSNSGGEGDTVRCIADVKKHPSHPLNKLMSILYLHAFSVVKNEMTTGMINMMMKNDCELSLHTGTITPKKYRRDILRTLSSFIE